MCPRNSPTVPSTSNKISAVGGTSYTYDSAGNITAIGTNGYVWSNQGLMKEYKISGVSTATYTYNAYNQRTKKVTGGVTTHYVYGAGGLLYGEYTGAGALVREYVYINGAPLAQVTAGSPETVAYLHTDHLGTPRYATNSGGTQVWAWTNDAFGTSAPTGSTTVNLRMPGQYYDSESALFYNWNRYYNPAIGRYISSDPIGLAGGLNTFNYANVSPVMYGDSTGLQTVMPVPGVPGLPLPIPPIAIPGSPENQQWVNWMQSLANNPNATQSSCPQAANDNDPNKCDDLIKQIKRDIYWLSKRHLEMLLDTQDLYNTAPSTEMPGKNGTWEGHQQAFNDRQDGLRKRVRQAELWRCPVPSEAYDWLSRSAPAAPAWK